MAFKNYQMSIFDKNSRARKNIIFSSRKWHKIRYISNIKYSSKVPYKISHCVCHADLVLGPLALGRGAGSGAPGPGGPRLAEMLNTFQKFKHFLFVETLYKLTKDYASGLHGLWPCGLLLWGPWLWGPLPWAPVGPETTRF